jgi:hypothetical protein
MELRIVVDGRLIEIGDDSWLTIPDYVKKFKLKSPVNVHKWIERGVIPKTHYMKLDGLMGITILRAVPYYPRPMRKHNFTLEDEQKMVKLYNQGERIDYLTQLFDCSQIKIYKIVKAHQQKAMQTI